MQIRSCAWTVTQLLSLAIADALSSNRVTPLLRPCSYVSSQSRLVCHSTIALLRAVAQGFECLKLSISLPPENRIREHHNWKDYGSISTEESWSAAVARPQWLKVIRRVEDMHKPALLTNNRMRCDLPTPLELNGLNTDVKAVRETHPARVHVDEVMFIGQVILNQLDRALDRVHRRKVFFVHSPSIPMLDVNIDFDAGSRYDPPGKAGLATLTAALLDKGAAALEGQPSGMKAKIADGFADTGAAFGGAAGGDRGGIGLRTLTAQPELDQSVALAAQLIKAPTYPDAWSGARSSA